MGPARSSRQRYREFVTAYKAGRLDAATEGGDDGAPPPSGPEHRTKRRAYLREYVRWLRPYRWRESRRCRVFDAFNRGSAC